MVNHLWQLNFHMLGNFYMTDANLNTRYTPHSQYSDVFVTAVQSKLIRIFLYAVSDQYQPTGV